MSNDPKVSSGEDLTKVNKLFQLDGQGLKILVESSMAWIKTNQQTINSLNVFPVPDGDTGTNMLLTMQAAYNEIAASNEKNIGKMAHGVAQEALMGARGNSGVILSQIWRGFARALDSLDVMDAALFVRALDESRLTAYKGVVRPVEGTILTVSKDIATAAREILPETNDILIILERIVDAADQSVKRTPDLLPILKQAGVVDSGGKGLFFLFEGMLRYLKGLSLEVATSSVQSIASMNLAEAMESVEEGQDYEVVVDFRPFENLDLEKFYADLSEIGTSIQVGEGDGMYRMHIHVPTENRYAPIDYTMGVGTITKVAMENLIDQMDSEGKKTEEKLNLTPVEPGQIAVIAVSPGIGISRIFASLGVAGIVSGGQTMNPSTEEIVKSFEDLPTDQIILLPNNKNIILAAQTAASVSVKKVVVIPTINVPQGLSAMLRLIPDGDFDQIIKEMNEATTEVETGEITTATRTVEINGINVHEGEVIALHNGKLVHSSHSLEDACLGLLKEAHADDRERITIFYGDNIAKPDVEKIVEKIQAAYPSHEFEVHEGGQPHYQFIIAIE